MLPFGRQGWGTERLIETDKLECSTAERWQDEPNSNPFEITHVALPVVIDLATPDRCDDLSAL